MAYSDISYITDNGIAGEQSLANVADKVNKPGQIADAATIANITGAIARADDIIDSYLRGSYSGDLPLADPPETVRNASAEIAVYLLYASVPYADDDNPKSDRYKALMAWLKDIAAGRAVLDLPSGKTNVVSTGNHKGSYADRQFSPDTLRGWL